VLIKVENSGMQWQYVFFHSEFQLIYGLMKNIPIGVKSKPGGLDVETNRDRDRERPSCRD